MTFKIPNTPDTAYFDQAEPDAGDFAALGERSTGVLSGCAVTAQGTPALFVDVASGTAVVAGTPITVGAGSLAIGAGGANPRFDLVVVNAAGVKSVLGGVAGTNPVFPTFDPQTYCLLAAVYVRQSAATIVATDIMDKRVTVAATFKRVYTDTTTEAISVTDSATKTWKVKSNGDMSWMSSLLRRVGDSAMEFATSLTLKAADTALAVLILKARASTPEDQKLLDVQASGSTTSLASISGTGVLTAANFIPGNGAPEGVVTAAKGAMYVDISFTDANLAVWIKSTAGGNTGWVSLRRYTANESALPLGTVFANLAPGASPPAGSLYCNGAQYSATDPLYTALYGLIGVTWGGTAGVNFNVPDFRGRSLFGAGGAANFNLGDLVGTTNGKTTLAVANLPAHAHGVNDPGHQHPKPYFPYFWVPPSQPRALSPMPSNMRTSSALPYLDNEEFGSVDYVVPTGISIKNTGSGTPATTLDPSGVINWFVRL